jgi:hypothetical protein
MSPPIDPYLRFNTTKNPPPDTKRGQELSQAGLRFSLSILPCWATLRIVSISMGATHAKEWPFHYIHSTLKEEEAS